MLMLLLLLNVPDYPKIVYQPIYVFSPIVIVVKEEHDICSCNEFLIEDQDISWGELDDEK